MNKEVKNAGVQIRGSSTPSRGVSVQYRGGQGGRAQKPPIVLCCATMRVNEETCRT